MRLRWNVGGVTITSITESETPTSPRFLFGADLSKADVLALASKARWLRPHFVSKDGYLLQKIQCLVIDTGEHRVAVDTCVGNDKDRRNPLWHHQQVPFLDDMATAGYPPESITHVVCTHLHVDHVGWNTRMVDGRWVPTFPSARYLFTEGEYGYWKNTPSGEDEDVFADSVAPIAETGLLDLVPSDHRLSDEVAFKPTPGHTPGHISVTVESQGQHAVITGDMIHHPLQFADLDVVTSFDVDPEAARACRRDVFPDWADGTTLVIGTHFGSPTAGRLRRDGDAYRFDV
jgi:glyoxylase-like metal-dependent hydrolase (beta-lactamase superfamily II)